MDRFILAGIAVIVTGTVAGVVWAPALLGSQDRAAPGQDENQQHDAGTGFDLGSTHEHAYLMFYLNDSVRHIGQAYQQNEAYAHFHAPDDVMHVHAEGVTLRDALSSSRIEVTDSCITFVPDNTSECGDVTVFIDGTPHAPSAVLDREIVQGQTLTITTAEEIPDDLKERRLPEQYRIGGQGA